VCGAGEPIGPGTGQRRGAALDRGRRKEKGEEGRKKKGRKENEKEKGIKWGKGKIGKEIGKGKERRFRKLGELLGKLGERILWGFPVFRASA
jgi:hypothetical protein